MKIIVLKGGNSTEREISLKSATKIAAAYKTKGHEVVELDTVLPISQIHENLQVTPMHIRQGSKNLVKLFQHEIVEKADFVFNALHGGFGEDGRVQALLDMLQLRYNGSGFESSGIAMDKIISKLLFQQNGIPTPDWIHFNKAQTEDNDTVIQKIKSKFKLPVIVKPAHEGSTVGLHFVKNMGSLKNAVYESLQYDGNVIVEEYIQGRELTVGFLDDAPLPVIEISPKHEIYDYQCKYTEGMSSYEVPARLDREVNKKISELAMKAYTALKCSGYARIDLRLNNNNVPYFLEMNTLPGMTDTSLVPKAARAAGIEFEDLLETIMQAGMSDE